MAIFAGDIYLMNKLERFTKKKMLEKDPLIAWCVTPGCDGWVRAKDFNVKTVECPDCKLKICF